MSDSDDDDDSYMPEPPETPEPDSEDDTEEELWVPLTFSLICAVALETKKSCEEAEAVLKAYRDVDEAVWVLKNS